MKSRLIIVLILSVFIIFPSYTTTIEDENITIGIAWRNDTSSSAFNRIKNYLEESGADVIVLEKAITDDLEYYSDGSIKDDYLQYDFSLTDEAAEIVKATDKIKAPASIDSVDLIVFTGGEDISPYLYDDSYLADEPIYNPDRDISDFLTLRLALDREIPVFGICRGMQLLAIYSGASLITDIPSLYENDDEAAYRHRSNDGGYTFHYVTVEEDSILSILKNEKVASSHHQAIDAASGGEYKVLAVDGDFIEAIEIPSSSFAYGIQFHPEYYSDYKDKKEWKVSLELLSRVIDKIDK